MRRVLVVPVLLTAALTAAVTLYLLLTVPPRAVVLDGRLPDSVVLGGYHIHTDRSDGTGSVETVAAAAERAGLAFVILTDHGDGTRTPDPPSYRHNVLVIDAVELNTTAGHLVALGLMHPSPYPLAGHPRDVIEDIRRMGGKAVIAHPDSPNPALRWRAQNVGADGIEWLNVDSEWRDDSPARLVPAAIRSIIRPPEAIATLLSRPVATLNRLDAAARQRPTFTLAALDAHANIGWRDTEEPRQRSVLQRPTYETMFRTVGQAAVLDEPLTRDAARDARAVLDALTLGRSYSIVRAIAGPAVLNVFADRGVTRRRMGDRLGDPAIATTFTARVPQAPGARVSLFLNGRPVGAGQGSVEQVTAGQTGSYRVEVAWPGVAVPWLVSNPIVIETTRPTSSVPPVDPAPSDLLAIPATTDAWTIEKESSSSGTVAVDGDAIKFAFTLAGGVPRGQYAALAAPISTRSGIDRVQFEARASQPVRVSVQLRLPGGRDGRRWRRSVYLDNTPRTIVAKLDEFEPVEPYTSQRPIVAPAQTLLIVADTLNTKPGESGTVWLSKVALGLREP